MFLKKCGEMVWVVWLRLNERNGAQGHVSGGGMIKGPVPLVVMKA